jgi:Na+-driven multidrug efflux pump
MNLILSQINQKKILIFWLPLAATWLMMAFEGPFLAAIIARLADPKYNLAAFGVAFSFGLIIEAPVIMIMSASTALVENKDSFIKLRNFTYFLNAAVTILMLIFLIPTIFYFVTIKLIGLPAEVAKLTHSATLILLPWPGMIGYRRFYQGVLIRSNLTRRVAYGTMIRLTTMALTALLLYKYFRFNGAVVGAAALSLAVSVEALASRLMAYRVVKYLQQENKEFKPLSYSYISKFYYPLALTSILALGVHPLVTFFVGRSPMPLESLAVLPVVNSLVFIFRALGLSYQEVAISLVGKQFENYIAVRNFAVLLSVAVVLCLALIAFTPFAITWFHDISGLSTELTEFALLPLQIMCLMPGLSVVLSLQRSILVAARKTAPVTWATIFEVSGIIAVLFITIFYLELNGAVSACLAFVLGRLVANLYLIYPYSLSIKQKGDTG